MIFAMPESQVQLGEAGGSIVTFTCQKKAWSKMHMTGLDILILAGAIFCALGALGSIVFWILYRARKQRSFKRGMACLDNRQFTQALQFLGQAEIDWGINIAHKTPKTIVRDLDRLDMIVTKVAEAALECGHIVDVGNLHDMIQARKEIWTNRKYLKFGSHSLKDAILERDRQIVTSIEKMRSQLRSIYPQKNAA